MYNMRITATYAPYCFIRNLIVIDTPVPDDLFIKEHSLFQNSLDFENCVLTFLLSHFFSMATYIFYSLY